MARRTKRTGKREAALLARLRAGESIYAACQAAKIGRTTLHEWRTEDDAFAKRVENAIDDGTDVLEDVLHTVAIRGNVAAILAALRARRRSVWGEKADLMITGKDGGPLVITGIAVPLPTRDDDGEDA